MARKIPEWESELWSYVSSGDGMHCPFYYNCLARQKGGWCFDDTRERLARLVDCEQCSDGDCDFVQCVECGKLALMIEGVAQKLIKKCEIHSPPIPTEVVSLADEQYPIEIHKVALKVHHGALWRERDRWVIQVREDDTRATQRFTVFHEVFHILAHCNSSTPVFRKRGAANVGAFNEELANYFAACILMPEDWVKEKWAEVNDLDRIAKIFMVPQSAMCIRLKALGLF